MNTFVTELKEGMNNTNIVKFNLLTGFVGTPLSDPSADALLQLDVSAATKIRTSSGQFIWSGTSVGDEVEVSSTFGGYITEGGGELDIEKQHITSITVGIKITLLIDSFMNCPEITTIRAYNNAKGDVVNLAKCSSLATLFLRNAVDVEGNIENLGKLPLTALNILNTKCIGRIEDYVKQQRLAGRTTYTNVDTICFNSHITFNKSALSYVAAVAGEFSWTADSITWRDTTIEA